MTEQDKQRCIDENLRFVRYIMLYTEIEPDRVWSINAWSEIGYPKVTSHIEIGVDDMRGVIFDEITRRRRIGADYCTAFYMEDNGRGEYEFISKLRSLSESMRFTLKKEDVFKEEE